MFGPIIRRGLRLLCGACLLAGATAGRAQDDVAARIGTQQDVIRRGETGTVEQAIPFRLTDPELGEIDIVSRQPRPKMFTFWTDQSFLYTSNAFLVPNGEQHDFFWNGRFDASFVPYATRNFTPRLTFEQNFFRYDEFSTLNFDSSSLQFDMKYDLNRDDTWFVNLSYLGAILYSDEPNTGPLSTGEDVGEFYKYGLLNASITHVRPLGTLPLRAAFTGGTNWRHGDPSDFDRISLFAAAVVFYAPIETIQFTAYIRPELQFYLHDPNSSSRTDFNLSGGVSAGWTPVEYLSIGATAGFTTNFSSTDPNDYNVFLPSVVLAARVAF